MFKFIKENIFMLLATALSLIVLFDQSIIIRDIDPEVKPLYKQYIHLAPKSCRDKLLDYNKITVKFDTLGASFIGICKEHFRERIIVLDRGFWLGVNDENRQQLFFHEMSHCFLGKDHVDDIDNYMFPVHFPVPHGKFLSQVKADIKEFCENED